MEYLIPKNTPAPVKDFIHQVVAGFSGLQVEVEEGGAAAGNWWIDFLVKGRRVTVEWRPTKGFGVYDSESDGYGDRPVEVFRNAQWAARRIQQILKGHFRIGIRELREIFGVSQADLAAIVGVQQAAVSKFESRSSTMTGFKLETLEKIVEQLGGSLEIVARFPNGEFRLLHSRHGALQS